MGGLRDCHPPPLTQVNDEPQGKGSAFVPTEIHVGTVKDDEGHIGILSILTREGLLDIALDRQAAEAIFTAIETIRSKLEMAQA